MSRKNNLKAFLSSYNNLLEIRKNAVGTVVSKGVVESSDAIISLEKQFSLLELNSSIGTSLIRDSFMKIFKKDVHFNVKQLLRDIQAVTVTYSSYTQRRSRYGILSPVAFCEESDLPCRLGSDESKCNLALTWKVVFKQLNVLCANSGLLDVLGVDRGELLTWWTGGEPYEETDTRAWIDVKMFAFKLVALFDRFHGNDRKEMSMIRLNDKDSQRKVEAVIPKLKELGQQFIRLLNIRQEHVVDILGLFEILVPFVYAFDMVLSYSDDVWDKMGPSALDFLEEYLGELCLRRDHLLVRLNAKEDIKKYSITDSKISPMPSRSNSEYAEEFTEAEKREKTLRLKQEAVDGLKELGLEEMAVIITSKVALGNGSFAMVVKCSAEHGDQHLAAKFLNAGMPNNPMRIKNRLLRESAFWHRLKNENVNALLGFCVHPDFDLPGLISQYCEFSLESFLDSDESRKADSLDRLCYMFDIASGLDYMHKNKVIHGDLRPPNILLVRDIFGSGYTAVLSDFGISYPDDESCEFDLTSMQRTNARYIAPELLTKHPQKGEKMISLPGDVYAFGCVFLQVMCGVRPYADIPKSQVEKCKRNGTLPVQKEKVDTRYWDFLQRTWRVDPDNRPKTSDLMIDIHSLKMSIK